MPHSNQSQNTSQGRDLKSRLIQVIKREPPIPSKADDDIKRYLLNSVLASPPTPRANPEAPIEHWLGQHGFDFNRAHVALSGRAEDEPEVAYSSFYIGGWVDIVAKPEQSVVIADSGHGKTMLLRMLKRRCTHNSKRLFVQWKRCIELMEEQRELAVSNVVVSLIEDVKSTLEQDSRWSGQAQKFEVSKSSWRQNLAALKDGLKSASIESIFVGLDNLDHYPETQRYPDRVRDLITALFRPEVLQENQSWFLKLFVSPRLFEQVRSSVPQVGILQPVPVNWGREGLKDVLQQRLQYMQKEGQSLAPSSLEQFADARLEALLLEEAHSPRDVVVLLRALMTCRAEKWEQSERRDDELDIKYEDWLDVQHKWEKNVR